MGSTSSIFGSSGDKCEVENSIKIEQTEQTEQNRSDHQHADPTNLAAVTKKEESTENNQQIFSTETIAAETIVEETVETTTTATVTEETVTVETTTAETTTAETTPVVDPLDAAIAIANTNTTQNEEGYESSDLEMASDDDSDSSDSDSSDSDEDDTKELIDLEEDDEGGPKDDILKTANEITDIIIEKPIFEMTPTTEVVSVGSIFSIIDNVIVVQSHPNPILALDMGTLFIYSDRDIMGEVFETFGPIARPFYSVRYTTADDMDKEKTILGDRVFYVPSYVRSKPIEVEVLKRMKGTDASNLYDEEAGEEEMEFSDDEKETQHRQSLKAKNKANAMRKRMGMKRTAHAAGHTQDEFAAAMADYHLHADQIQQAPPPPGRQLQSYADM